MSLIATHVSKEYPTRSGSLSVLRDVNLSLSRGDSVAIMGPSGSGKSTLLHILGTLDRPELRDDHTRRRRSLRPARARTGRVPQSAHRLRVPGSSPVAAMLGAGERAHSHAGQPRHATARRPRRYARQLLDRVGLAGRLDHRPAELSGGERQRVAVARALVLKPVLLLADEPTGNLDRKNAQAVGELLLDLHRQENNILVVVTHSIDLAKLFPARSEVNDGALIAL